MTSELKDGHVALIGSVLHQHRAAFVAFVVIGRVALLRDTHWTTDRKVK